VGEGPANNPLPLLTGALRRGRCKQCLVRNPLDWFWTYEHEGLRFLNDLAVPFDCNQAERDLRMVNVQQKPCKAN
jgi:transposase